ncbi:MAG: extracellular solute-binding protein [Sedimenticola sp.]
MTRGHSGSLPLLCRGLPPPIWCQLSLGALGVLFVSPNQALAGSLTIYSSRKAELIDPILQQFSDNTGVKINYVHGKANALIKQILEEGDNSQADLLLTSDVGTLIAAADADVLQPIHLPILATQIPPSYRDPDDYWYGLTIRARVVVYASSHPDSAGLTGYEDLADPRWRGRVCMRSSGNVYNRSLVAALIERWGEEITEAWARGVVANLARPPQGGDRDQIRAIANGECDLTLANHYYYVMMHESDNEADRTVTGKTSIRWPNQTDDGAHINISGGGVAKHAPNRADAIRLLEYLISTSVQLALSQTITEYPMIPGIPVSNTMVKLGSFHADTVSLGRLATHGEAVTRIVTAAGWK